MEILNIKNVEKIYNLNGIGTKTKALTNVTFSVNEGEFVAIMGESGSGKSTLLNLIATLDKPTKGNIIINGSDLSSVDDKEMTKFRREKLGFVFQDFNVLNTLSNKDNILLPLVLSGVKASEMEERVNLLAQKLKINEILVKKPYEISGGQRQRVAIARAIITNPSILLADEPTGALDSKSSENILNIFSDINKQGQSILMVTHSIIAASYASRVLFIKDGTVTHEIYKGDSNNSDFRDKISQSLAMLSKGGI